MFFKRLALAGVVSLMGSAAFAACSYENDVPIKSLSAGFEAWKAVTDAMAECGNFQAELDQEFRTKQPAAFEANPALYQIGGVSNGTITPLGSGHPAILDRGLVGHAEISLGSGVEGWAIHIDPADLVEAFDVTIGDVAKD